MKNLRSFSLIFAVALTGLITHSCIEEQYDLNNLSKRMELFGNSLAFPVGSTTVRLNSLIGGLGIDTSILKVQNGTYVFQYSGNMDMSAMTNSLTNFALGSPTKLVNSINLYDATDVPATPFDIPPMDYTFNASTSMTLPNFSTDLIRIDSIDLTNTVLRITASSVGLGGPKLNDCLSITYTAQGNGTDYYINGVKKDTWTVDMGDTAFVEIKKVRLAADGSSSLSLNQHVKLSIASAGDVVATENIQTKLIYTMEFVNPIDFDVVYGKINYSMANDLDPINFSALGTILGDNDVLSFYNPRIELNTVGNLGVPIDIKLNMGTENSKTGQTRNLTNTAFRMEPAANASEIKVNTFVIDRENGTSDLFKINPDRITMGYDVKTDTTTTYNHFLAKSSQFNLDYKMEIPFQFGGDLLLNLGTTINAPLESVLSALEDQDSLSIGIALNVTNRIPLALKLRLTALNEDSVALFTAESDTITAGGPIDPQTGFATDSVITNTDLTLTPAQINFLQDTKKFRIAFTVTANNQAAFISVQPSDYIQIKLGVRADGGVVLDLDKLQSEGEE